MSEVVRWFLLFWDRHEGHTDVVEFAESSEAFAAFVEAEQTYTEDTLSSDPRFEIVLIGAESRDELVRAYPHYFSRGSRTQRMDDLLVTL